MNEAKQSTATQRALALVVFLLLASSCAWAQTQQPQRSRARQRDSAAPVRDVPRYRDTLQPGDLAPDFELKSLDGKQTVRLSSFRGKKPVLLIFGSYT